jgi:cell division septation protein DedD
MFGLGALFMAWMGCTSAETGASNRSGDPQPEPTPMPVIQPARVDSTIRAVEPSKPPVKKPKSAPRLRTSQDTLKVASARKSRVVTAPLVKPPNASYTVQVGAFRQAQNALRLHNALKKKVAPLPVYNKFHGSDKLYRVSVGSIKERKEASALRRKLMASDSTFYKECWVTYLSR